MPRVDDRFCIDSLLELQQRIDYRFADPDLLLQAVTHSSWGADNNERLEFLGDAVLDMVTAAELYSLDPGAAESALSIQRASLVCNANLSEVARRLRLQRCLRLGLGEQRSGGGEKNSVLAGTVEAICAAVFLDGGLEAASKVIRNILALEEPEGTDSIHAASADISHPKSVLQELLAKCGSAKPSYTVSRLDGPSHRPNWQAVCSAAELNAAATGTGASKQEAETNAAKAVLEEIGH